MSFTQLAWCALTTNKPYIRGLVGDLASMSALHLELFMAEARIEAERVKRKAVLLLAASLLLAIALVFFLGAIIASAWDTPYRMHMLFGVPIVVAMVGGIFYWLASSLETPAAPFARSAAELRKDADWMMSLL